MNTNLVKTAIRLGAVVALVSWASWAIAAKPPQNTPHACRVSVADRSGDSLLSEGLGIYTDGLDAQARLWDMVNGVADHLYFLVDGSGRNLKLSIPGITNGVQTCSSGKLQPNVNASGYQFYNLLPIGSSTTGSQNFGGTFGCSYGAHGWDAVNVTYESQCIVITHTADKMWTITADTGCTATVTKIQNRQVIGQWVGQDVPFQVQATELP
jgi:hypothetical protein